MSTPTPAAQAAAFLALLPGVRAAAWRQFRHVRCPDRREDGVCEAVALAWAWHRRLWDRGRDPAWFAFTFARLAARAAASGRRLAGQDRANDALSPVCRRARGFALVPLAGGPAAARAELEEALADNTKSPVPAQAQFRIDFPAWAGRLPAGKRWVLLQLAVGQRTRDVARAAGVTAARISQLRGEFRRGYLAFLAGDPGRAADPPGARPDRRRLVHYHQSVHPEALT